MARIPSRIQQSPAGTVNLNGRTRPVARITLQKRSPALALEHTGDRQTQALQHNINQAFAPVAGLPFANGNMIEGVQFTYNTTQTIQHGLPHAFRGYMLLNIRSLSYGAPTVYLQPATTPASVSRVPSAPAADSKQITLVSQGIFTADVWIYV